MFIITLIILLIPFLFFTKWLYKKKWIGGETLKHKLYAFTIILVTYSLYMVVYFLIGNFLDNFDTEILQKISEYLMSLAYALSFFVFPLAALFVVISLIVYLFTLISNRRTN